MSNVYQVSDDKELSIVLKQMKDGDVLELRPNEYKSFSINKNISITTTVKNQNACIVDSKSPVIDIKSKQVHLENLEIEFCESQGYAENGVAVKVSKKCQLQTRNVIVKGAVQGIVGEEDKWDYPSQLHLGNMFPKHAYIFKIVLRVPCKCKARSMIADIKISPKDLLPGLNTITIQIERLRNNVALWGDLIIETDLFSRKIVLCGHVVAFDEDKELEYVTNDSIIWEPLLEPVIPPKTEPKPEPKPEPEQESKPKSKGDHDPQPTRDTYSGPPPGPGKTGRKIISKPLPSIFGPLPIDTPRDESNDGLISNNQDVFDESSPFTIDQSNTSHGQQSTKNEEPVKTKYPKKKTIPVDPSLGKRKAQDVSKIADIFKKASPAIESESKTDYEENNTQESLEENNDIFKNEAEQSKGKKRIKSIPIKKIWS